MTPLTVYFTRYLPASLVLPAVTLTYAVTLTLLVLFGRPVGNDIIYIDLQVVE